MSCNGILIPHYKRSKQTSVNPYYGSTDSNLASLGVNTHDEFIVTEVLIEGNSICSRCKKEICDENKKKEIGLQRSRRSRN